MPGDLVIRTAVFVAIVALAAVLLTIIRLRIVPRSLPIGSIVAVLLAVVLGQFAVNLSGAHLFANTLVLLLSVFVGTLWVQPQPLVSESLCRALAAASGLVALLAAAESNLIATGIALGVTGFLLQLAR